MVLQFTFNKSAYGFGGQSSCDRDYIKFYNGIGSDAELSVKVCSDTVPSPFTVTSMQVKVVFRGSSTPHVPEQVGAEVTFDTVELGMYSIFACAIHWVMRLHSGKISCGATIYIFCDQTQNFILANFMQNFLVDLMLKIHRLKW